MIFGVLFDFLELMKGCTLYIYWQPYGSIKVWFSFCPFSLMRNQGFDEVKGRKNQGRLNRSSPRPSKCLTLRSRSDFFEVKRQAPLHEGQALSRPLRTLPRTSAMARAPNPVKSRRSQCNRTTLTPFAVIAVPHSRNEVTRDLLCGNGIIIHTSFSALYPTTNDNKRL